MLSKKCINDSIGKGGVTRSGGTKVGDSITFKDLSPPMRECYGCVI